MTGWNLPPGCRVSDLPGNEPEDPVAEALGDLLYERLPEDRATDELFLKIMELIDEARNTAYHDGMADEAMARSYAEEKALIAKWKIQDASHNE